MRAGNSLSNPIGWEFNAAIAFWAAHLDQFRIAH